MKYCTVSLFLSHPKKKTRKHNRIHKMLKKILLLFLTMTSISNSIEIPAWNFEMNEYEMTVGGRKIWISLPENRNDALFPVYLSLVIDPYYPKAERNESVCKSFGPFDIPEKTFNASTCFDSNSSSTKCGEFWAGCCFDSRAGSIWNQRIKQILLANGVAMISMNPSSEGWNYPSQYWDSGTDKSVFEKLFQRMNDAKSNSILGRLDRSRVVVRGFSGGAQMVSWLIEKWAEGNLTQGMEIKGGVYLSGGTYACYDNDNPRGVCRDCNQSAECNGLTQSCNLGNHSTSEICCDYCCPQDFAESYFDLNPDAWKHHPPAFLAQLPVDYNADLCATRNYHDTLKRHGVESHLYIDELKDMDCYCFGREDDPAASGSPFLDRCYKKSSSLEYQWGETCFPHAMGFASMVEPAAEFVISKLL